MPALTAAELIAQLQKLPPETLVFTWGPTHRRKGPQCALYPIAEVSEIDRFAVGNPLDGEDEEERNAYQIMEGVRLRANDIHYKKWQGSKNFDLFSAKYPPDTTGDYEPYGPYGE
ncbi:hypothetical protein [Gloeobacter morelensis]|uniref:hypothetical protein n=1 Tax=Gloeobacter morelensis TaxID=2907343 RepID=UPI001E425BFD|nr:hypothetical protein [Gloeobacter morelensis]UFP97280.1 hypothetical protein ISF26_24470 [Gloeobacter morelensis MG652769]